MNILSLVVNVSVCVHVNTRRPHRGRVVLVPSGADHPAQNLQAVDGDVSRCVDGFLGHHLAVDHHFGARLADCDVELCERQTCSLSPLITSL